MNDEAVMWIFVAFMGSVYVLGIGGSWVAAALERRRVQRIMRGRT